MDFCRNDPISVYIVTHTHSPTAMSTHKQHKYRTAYTLTTHILKYMHPRPLHSISSLNVQSSLAINTLAAHTLVQAHTLPSLMFELSGSLFVSLKVGNCTPREKLLELLKAERERWTVNGELVH